MCRCIPEGGCWTITAWRSQMAAFSAAAARDTGEFGRSRLELPEHALLPGLINSHGHAAMSLLRGYADDQPLMPWLETAYLAGGGRACERGIRSRRSRAGYCRNAAQRHHHLQRYVFFPRAAAAAATRWAFAASSPFPVFDFPTAWADNADEYISKGLALRDDVKHSKLVTVVLAPRTLHRVRSQPGKSRHPGGGAGLAVHIHLHETRAKCYRPWNRTGNARWTPCTAWACSAPHPVRAHDRPGRPGYRLLAATGAHVVHCPQSNMKLASGACPVGKLAGGRQCGAGHRQRRQQQRPQHVWRDAGRRLLAKLTAQDATARRHSAGHGNHGRRPGTGHG